MDKVLIVLLIAQLLSTAYGLAVIESIKPIVENELRDKGYIKNRNSLYNFSSTISDIAKCFIPFYYLSKSFKLISNKNLYIDKEVENEINSGNYVLENNNIDDSILEEEPQIIIENDIISYEKPEKYTARKNDISIYDTYETPVEYISRQAKPEDNIELTPFLTPDKVVETVVVKSEVNMNDIAKAITDLNIEELERLKQKLITLTDIKKEQLRLKLEKDVA